MGSDKALLPIGRANLLQLIFDKARHLVPQPVIVGSRARYAQYGEVIEDVIRGCGPLSGIHAALSATQTDQNLILSVDMPLMTAEFLLWLLERTSANEELVIVPEADGRVQPLCAVYRRAAYQEVERALRIGEYKVDRLFSLLPTRSISETEWLAAGFPPHIFRNVNTPQDYDAVASMLEVTPQTCSKSLNS